MQNILIEEKGQKARTMIIVDHKSFPNWQERAGSKSCEDAQFLDFHALEGQILNIPGLDEILVGVQDVTQIDLAVMATVVDDLPSQDYRVTVMNDDGQESELGFEALLGWQLTSYSFDRYKSKTDLREPARVIVADHALRMSCLAEAQAIALVRDLVNAPANDLLPDSFAQTIRQVVEPFGPEVSEIKGEELINSDLRTIYAVGQSSKSAPRLLDIRWGEEGHSSLTLVGKGVCFDTGGLDIKSASNMLLMKKDMGGAATALALAQMVMKAKLPVRLRLLLPLVENTIAGDAYRPGDVIKTYSGKTVEVTNTDAEGRLILCDALSLADLESPDLLLDFATLTGAARIALGPRISALFCDDDNISHDIIKEGESCQDPVWRMPLYDGYQDYLNSQVADLTNAASTPMAGAITAALFLKNFVKQAKFWAHFDIYCWNGTARPDCPVGGDAQSLRAAWRFIRNRFSPDSSVT